MPYDIKEIKSAQDKKALSLRKVKFTVILKDNQGNNQVKEIEIY